MPEIQGLQITPEVYTRLYIGREIDESFKAAAALNRERFSAAARFVISLGIPRLQSAITISLSTLFGLDFLRFTRLDFSALSFINIEQIGKRLGFTSTVTTTFEDSQSRLLDESCIGGVTVLRDETISPILPGPMESIGLSAYILPSTYIHHDLPGGRTWPPYTRTYLSRFFTSGIETSITWFQIQTRSIH